jgi:hypothetical protein
MPVQTLGGLLNMDEFNHGRIVPGDGLRGNLTPHAFRS